MLTTKGSLSFQQLECQNEGIRGALCPRCRVPVTQWVNVRVFLAVLLLTPAFSYSQPGTDEDYRVYTDSPRLLLTRARLRLLQRERERQSMRWQQFDALVSGGAPMPEPGFADALYYRVSGNASWSKQAVDWALSGAAQEARPEHLRQLSLVFDWCEMSDAQRESLGAKIEKGLGALVPPSANASIDVTRQSVRALAAIAIADRLPDHGESVLKPIIEQWWRGDVAKRLLSGQAVIPHEQSYALLEFMHAVRDNLKIDLRDGVAEYFKSYPIDHLVSHYPAPFQAPENEYRVPVYVRSGEPNVQEAILSRAAEFAMVALDPNAAEVQFLQGWLMQDRFLMRGALGVAYEYLWANPYQPGLSYFQVPLVVHNATNGHLFARTSWDEDATWIGYFEGNLQVFRDGQIQSLKPGATTQPIRVGDTVVLTSKEKDQARFRADAEGIFVLGLNPHTVYEVEIDDQELSEEETDNGGTLVLSLPEGIDAGVRVRKREN
jgi:hypothetical protein